MVQAKEVPHGGQEHGCACGYEAKEEDDDEWVLVMHEISAQAGAIVRDAAICEGDIESSECRGDVDKEQAVKEAYGCVPSSVRGRGLFSVRNVYLKAGSRPKKATNVTRDTVMVKTMMVRATVMVKEGQTSSRVAWRNKRRDVPENHYRDILIVGFRHAYV